MSLRLPVALSVALTLALPATVHANPHRYADRLAENATKAGTESNCLVLRSIDLCGWRATIVSRATRIAAEVGCADRRSCWYEWTGETAQTRFFCRGYMAYYPRYHRWVADQSLDCYADDDPSWGFTDDGVLVREP